MEIISSLIQGVILLRPKFFEDERGRFYESWRARDYLEAGIQEEFLQDNYSRSRKDVLRGLHFQTGQKAQGQLVTVFEGSIIDVCVDIRPKSKTFGKHVSFKLSWDCPEQVYMPPGIAHGFCVLSEIAILHYKCTQYYSPGSESGIRWDDPDLKIQWPIQNPIVSEKDKKFDSFAAWRDRKGLDE